MAKYKLCSNCNEKQPVLNMVCEHCGEDISTLEEKGIDYQKLFDQFIEISVIVLKFIWKYLIIIGIFLWKYILIISKEIYKFVKKYHKERWFMISSGALVVVILLLIIFGGGNNAPAFNERVTDYQVTVEADDKPITFEMKDLGIEVTIPGEFVEDDMTLDVEPTSASLPEWTVDSFIFDVDLEGLHMLPGVVEFKVAYDTSLVPKGEDASMYVSAMYLNGNTWEYVYYEVDERAGEVLIKTDHFSIFGIFFGDNHPDNKEVEQIIPDKQIDEINPLKAEVDGVSLAWSEVNKYMGITNKVGSFADGAVELTETATKNVSFIQGVKTLERFNGMLDNYGKGVFVFGLAKSVYEGKTDQAVLSAVKQIGETLIGGFSNSVKRFGGAAMFAIDYSLNEFIKEAFDGAEANWEKTYNHYYDEEEYMGKSALYWRDFVLGIYDANPPEDYFGADPYMDFVNKQIDSKINQHLELIWNDLDTAYLAASDLGIGRLNVPSNAVKDKIEANYKAELYSERIIPAFASVNRILIERAELARANELRDLAFELTRERTIFVNGVDTEYKITDGTNIFKQGSTTEDIIYTLEEFIDFDSNNLYFEVIIDGETKTMSLPEGFPTQIYSTIELTESDAKTRESVFTEYGVEADEMIDTLLSIEDEAMNTIILSFMKVLGKNESVGADGEKYYFDDIEGERYKIIEYIDKDLYGWNYDIVYNVTYKDINLHMDQDFNIISLYTLGQSIIDISSWDGYVDMKAVILPTGERFEQVFDSNGLVKREEYKTDSVYLIIHYNEDGSIAYIQENGEVVYNS